MRGESKKRKLFSKIIGAYLSIFMASFIAVSYTHLSPRNSALLNSGTFRLRAAISSSFSSLIAAV